MKCPHCEIDKTKDILFIMIGYRGKDSKSVDFGKWAATISSKMSGKSQDRFIKSMKDKNIL